MKRKTIGIILTGLALALPWLDSILLEPDPKPDPAPVPVPITPPVDVPISVAELLKVGFAGKKQEASTWAGLLFGMARTIESDLSHPGGARLKTMLDVANLRDWMVACPPKPVSGGDVIGQAIGPELNRLGSSDELLEESGRRSSVVKLLDGAGYYLEGLGK